MATTTDLFNEIDTLPTDVQQLILSYHSQELDYMGCEELKQNLERLGYTCDYGLDAVPFDLKEIED